MCDDMYEKPTCGVFRVLADGGYGNRGTSTIVMLSGRGKWIASQFKLISAFDAEPMAGELLKRMLRYALDQAKNPLSTGSILTHQRPNSLVRRSSQIWESAPISRSNSL